MNNQPYNEQEPQRHVSALKIIGAALLIMVLICGGLVTYAAYNYRNMVASLARGPMVGLIDQTGLPDAQKISIKQNISRVADAFQQGQMSHSQFKAVLQNLHIGPFFYLMIVEAARARYVTVHPSMDEDRRRTMLTLDRFERGIVAKQIPSRTVNQVMALLPDPDEPKSGQKAQPVTEADLKPAFDAMKAAADAAAIPPLPFQPDFAAEVDKAVSAVLGPTTTKSAGTMPASTQPTASAPASRPVLGPVDLKPGITLNNDGVSRARAARS